jgi:hypothetical protein
MSVLARSRSRDATAALWRRADACFGAAPAPRTPAVEPQGRPAARGHHAAALATVSVTRATRPADALVRVGARVVPADLRRSRTTGMRSGGSPEACADIVSSPYLVSYRPTANGDRLDDPTRVLGTFPEDEDRFGWCRYRGAASTSAATASGFLDRAWSVAACPGYRLTGENGAPTTRRPADATESGATRPSATRGLTVHGGRRRLRHRERRDDLRASTSMPSSRSTTSLPEQHDDRATTSRRSRRLVYGPIGRL